MLKLFEVSGYTIFDEKITLDFSDVRDYKFNTECIEKGLIGKMIIYGKNAVGKTMFANALIDVASHIWPKTPAQEENDNYYLNANGLSKYAEFKYIFQFDEDQVEYIYRKENQNKLIYEEVSINNELLFLYDRKQTNNNSVEGLRKLSPTLILDFENVGSVLRYVFTNTPLSPDNPLRKTREFIGGMNSYELLRFQSRISPNTSFAEILSDDELLKLESLLKDAGIDESLIMLEDNDGKKRLYFDKPQPLPFFSVASSGTIALLYFFLVQTLLKKDNSSLLIMDEFDAFYHFELAEHIVKLLQKTNNTQIIFTSHNTNLLSNRLMRPDCLFVMTKNKLTSLPNATRRELREGHNLEKLYMSGEFD